MKNCVLTIAVGDTYERMAKLTHPAIKSYADKIEADFVTITESTTSTPHWEKFNAIYSLLNKYERIIYVDTDIIIRDDCPNLFDIVPTLDLGLFNEMPFTGGTRSISLIDSCKDYGIILKSWDHKYYNTGVMVVSRRHKQMFKKPEKEAFSFYEQGYLNAKIAQTLESVGNELSIFQLPYMYNRITVMDGFTGEERFASYMIHYAGYPSLEFVLSLIESDLKKWKHDSPNYSYKRHILIDVQGGLGDQICAQPAIRFLKKHLYPNDDVNVITHYPILFENMDLPIYKHGDFQRQQDTPYYHALSLPGPNTGMWSIVSNLLSHTVDFCSMALLKRTLPLKDKSFELEVKLEAINEILEITGIIELSQLVLVHAGRHWGSKTFPIEWWQDVIDGLHKDGHKVCLIGYDEKTRGVLDLQVREGMIDARNLLSLDGLISLLSSAKVLISNDSAPVHLAGAFDNYIILIPTCKHPDHILPYRNGSINYRTYALYKKIMAYEYDSRPTTVHQVLGDKVAGDYYDYLPEVKDVVNKVKEIM